MELLMMVSSTTELLSTAAAFFSVALLLDHFLEDHTDGVQVIGQEVEVELHDLPPQALSGFSLSFTSSLFSTEEVDISSPT